MMLACVCIYSPPSPSSQSHDDSWIRSGTALAPPQVVEGHDALTSGAAVTSLGEARQQRSDLPPERLVDGGASNIPLATELEVRVIRPRLQQRQLHSRLRHILRHHHVQ
jgi:hypothetical protein